MPLMVLAAFSFVLAHGRRWFLPVLAAQSLLLAAAGERTPVIVDAIALILLLAHAGCKLSTRQLQAALALTAVAILAVTGVRTEQGRAVYYRDSGLGARVSALASGLTGAGTTQAGQPGLVAQAAVRLDGADFAGAIDQAEHLGKPRLSAAYVPESLLLVVPSATWPSKLSRGDDLNPALLQLDAFGLQQVNRLPGMTGMYFGLLSPAWPIVFLALAGLLAGCGERWLLRSCSAASLILIAGAAIAALSYERGLPGMLVAFRAAVVVAVAVKLADAVRVRKARRECLPASPASAG